MAALYLDDINDDVDGSIDCQHEVIQLGDHICPFWPIHQLPVVDHLVGLVGVCDQLGGVAADEDHHYGREKGGHGIVSSMVNRDGVVEDGCPDKKSNALSYINLTHLRIPLYMRQLRTERRMTGMRLMIKKLPN